MPKEVLLSLRLSVVLVEYDASTLSTGHTSERLRGADDNEAVCVVVEHHELGPRPRVVTAEGRSHLLPWDTLSAMLGTHVSARVLELLTP